MPIPAIIGALGALAAGGLSHLSARSQQQRAIDAQRSMQTMLLNNSGSIMARNARQAGLSPAFALGNSSVPTSSSVSTPSANFDASGFQSLLGGYAARKLQRQQEKQSEAQTKLDVENAKIAEQKAEQERINTDVLKNKIHGFETTYQYTDVNTGKIYSGDELDTYAKEHPDIVPNIDVIYNRGSYGKMLGELERDKYYLEKNDIRLKQLQNELDRGIYTERKNDEEFIKLLARGPKEEVNKTIETIKQIQADVRNKDTQAALNGAEMLYKQALKRLTELQANELESGSIDALFKNFTLENFLKFAVKKGLKYFGM